MKSLLSLLVLAIAIGAVYPLVAEHEDSYCSALESRYKFVAATRAYQPVDNRSPLPVVFQAETAGSSSWIADYVVRNSLARLPTPVACDLGYWHSVAFPNIPLSISNTRH